MQILARRVPLGTAVALSDGAEEDPWPVRAQGKPECVVPSQPPAILSPVARHPENYSGVNEAPAIAASSAVSRPSLAPPEAGRPPGEKKGEAAHLLRGEPKRRHVRLVQFAHPHLVALPIHGTGGQQQQQQVRLDSHPNLSEGSGGGGGGPGPGKETGQDGTASSSRPLSLPACLPAVCLTSLCPRSFPSATDVRPQRKKQVLLSKGRNLSASESLLLASPLPPRLG